MHTVHIRRIGLLLCLCILAASSASASLPFSLSRLQEAEAPQAFASRSDAPLNSLLFLVFHAPHAMIHVPEPSALLLFSMGLLGLICVLINERRRQHRPPKQTKPIPEKTFQKH